MPQSKNRRKNKSAQTRKVNQAKAEKVQAEKIQAETRGKSNHERPGEQPKIWANPQPPLGEQSPIPADHVSGIRTHGFSPGWNSEPEYKVDSFFDEEDLDDSHLVDFEMTEAHFRATEISKVDFMAEIGGGDNMGPDVASVTINRRDKIIGHPRWKTGEDAITELDQDPNVFRGEFNGNRWQGRGSPWAECTPERTDCWDRQGITSCANSPVCIQCIEGMKTEETHYHILEEEEPGRICQKCWTKGSLPPENQVEKIEFTKKSISNQGTKRNEDNTHLHGQKKQPMGKLPNY